MRSGKYFLRIYYMFGKDCEKIGAVLEHLEFGHNFMFSIKINLQRIVVKSPTILWDLNIFCTDSSCINYNREFIF